MPYATRAVGVSLVALGIFCGSAAQADELFSGAPAYDWSGFYLGGHLGYGETDVDGIYDSSGGAPPDRVPFGLDLDGLVAGAHAGYNWQMSSFVFGVEGDVSLADWDDSIFTPSDNETVSADIGVVATLRGRLGFAWDRVLIYGTGGLAVTDGTYTANDGPPGDTGQASFNDLGAVVAGGFEWAFNDAISFRAEGLYFFFDDTPNVAGLTSDSDAGDSAELKDAWVVRGGFSIHLPPL